VDFNTARNFGIPSGTVPVGVLNGDYSFILRNGVCNNGGGCIISAGTSSGYQCSMLRSGNGGGYENLWYTPGGIYDTNFGLNAIGTRFALTFDGSTRRSYLNGVAGATQACAGLTTAAAAQHIGSDIFGGSYNFNGQLYYLLVFGIAVPAADVAILST
jgi:hypothetical protein